MENQPLKKPTPRVALWQQQAELLAHLCQFSQNVLCVVAPHNSGKTEFIQYFLDLPLPRLYKHALYSEQKTVDAMMQKIAQLFNLPWDKQSTLPLQVEADGIAQHQDSTWVLLVDDADFMSPECLKALLQLSQTDLEPRRQLHIILFGQPELEQTLAQDEFQSIIKGHSHTLELAQASIDTVKRAATMPPTVKKNTLADLDEDGLFEHQSDHIFQEPVSRKTAKPHGVNMATKTLSLDRARQMLVHPIALGALAGVGLGIIYLSLNPMDDAEWQNPPTQAAQLAEVNWETSSQPLNIKVLSASREAMTNASAVQEGNATTQTNANQAPILAATDNNSSGVATTAVVSDVTAADKAATVSKTAAAVDLKTVAPAIPVSKQATAKPATKTLLSAENKLLNANAKFYTLQLMGGKNQASIKQFINTHKIADKAYTYRKQVKGDLWYVVVLGEYPSKESAQKAIQTLPPALRQNVKPWVRSIESVQQEINSAQG
ncbi:AAA family ATPase [Candidatus Berkiella cookevillensis]|uniref:AAA family ATPase n=1 Tax=Candidatus Berkiella cookevillensis TaxID=437022 RepID=A0A0Q9YAU4_9GAMM|nr:AAA family ATPase [Candidatus Berkiella cookevillensis]MCS5709581.1 AAA family ATPase [Candidatus Berkiella cookevillensis]